MEQKEGQASRELGSETGGHGEWWGPECLRLEGPETMGSMRWSTHPRLKWGPTWLPSRAQRRRGLTRPPFWPQSLVSFPVTKIPGMAPCEASMIATLGQAVTFTVIWLGCMPSPMMLGPGHIQRHPPPAPTPAPTAFLMDSRILSRPGKC